MEDPYICWRTSSGREEQYLLSADETIIGRKRDAQIVLSDLYISRQHAKVVREGSDFYLIDLESTHGTQVNGQNVKRHKLRHGDKIGLGNGRIQLDYLASPSGGPSESRYDLKSSVSHLTQVVQSSERSDLEKFSYLLDFQYQWENRLSAEKTFQHILRAALTISGAERSFLVLNRGKSFEFILGINEQGQVLEQDQFEGSHSVIRQVVQEKKPMFLVGGIPGDLAQQQSIVALQLKSIACLPLIGIGFGSDQPEILGILYLDSKKQMHSLSGLDQRILGKLSADMVSVLEKLELIKGFQERELLERELALAHETQRSLLPQFLPEPETLRISAFSHATRQVGGDFYDFFQIHGDECAGIVGDVSGKGVAAALVSSLLLGAFAIQYRSGRQPGEIFNELNLFLHERSSANRFVTVFFWTLDSSGQGKFISAGHNPAYVFRSASGDISELTSSGLIMGAFPFATYEAGPFQLEPGDVLVVYSDGLTEAENPAGAMFGEEKLKSLIRDHAFEGGEELQERILQSLEQFTEGHPQTDDITLTLVERKTSRC